MNAPANQHPPAPGWSRAAIAEVWSIAWPTVMTMASYTVMQFVDKVMVARLGPMEVAAQGNGGVWAFTPIAFAMGLLTVVNTYVAQHLGAGRIEEGPKYAWASLWLSLVVWVVVLLPFAVALPHLFALTGHDPALVMLEGSYGQVLLLGSVVMMAGRGIHHFFFGLHRPKVVTVSAIAGNLVNVGLNYVLIFGHFGMPRLELIGAAIGTVGGTVVELAIPMAIFLGRRMNEELATRRAWRPRMGPIREIVALGWPASVQFGNEILCWSIFMVLIVGQFGVEHMTAGWAALGYMHMSFMPAVGFSVAVTSLVGRYIGAGHPDVAVARARLGLLLTVVYMSACAIAFVLFRHDMIQVFISDAVTDAAQAARIVKIGSTLLVCVALFQTIDAFGIIYSGALRGAGDTVWPGACTIIYAWAFIVGLGWTMSETWPALGSLGPWIGAAVYLILLGITMCVRFERGAWRSIQLIDRTRPSDAEALEQDAARVAPLSPGPPAPGPDSSMRDFVESEGHTLGPSLPRASEATSSTIAPVRMPSEPRHDRS